MKLVAFFLFFFIATSFAQPDKNAVKKQVDIIYSKVLNENRHIWIYVPDKKPQQHYPVIYVLDAEVHFDSVINTIRQIREAKGNKLPEMIVVGIAHIWDRYRDYTPTHVTASPYMDQMAINMSGGGEKFTSFIENELIPHIDSLYPVAHTNLLLGHSMGGLLVMNTLLNHTKLFDYYIAIEPSMWYDKQNLLHQSETILKEPGFKGRHLFLAAANTFDTTSLFTLANMINTNKSNQLKFDWKYYSNHTHISVVPDAMRDGLEFVYKFL